MNLFNKLQDEYDQLWKYIIRPIRTTYPETHLGPEQFDLEGIIVERNDFQLVNPKGLVFYGSHFYPVQANSYPCCIYLHGNSSNRTEGMELLGQLIKNNISLCTFDFTGCGNAEGEYISLGYHEWKDVEEVYKYLRTIEKIKQIGLWGRSMGAVTALRYLKMNSQIKVAIMDSPFKSLKELIIDLCKRNSKIPAFILSGALKIISSTIKEKADFDVYDLTPIKNQAPQINTPGFFIVGEDDELIPHTHTVELFNAYRCKKKELRIVAGEHNSQRPQSCVSDAVKFLKKYLHKERKEKVIEVAAKAEDVDFFDLDQEPEAEKKQEQLLNEIDFFASKEMNEINLENEKAFENFQHDFSQQMKKQKNPFSLSDIFQGVFNAKSKKQKKEVNDGYSELRTKVKALVPEKDKKKDEKGKKQMKQYDDTFDKMFEQEYHLYIWA